jgi:methyl-accepting chemotaxis protein
MLHHLGRSRLFWKLYASYTGLTLLTATLIGVLVTWHIARAALQEEAHALQAKAVLLRELVTPALDRGADPTLQARVRALGEEIGTRLTVIRADGTVVIDSEEDPSRMANHGNREEILEAERQGMGTAQRFSQTVRATMFYLALPVRSDHQLLGYVRASRALSHIDAEVSALRFIVLLGAGIAAAASLLLGLWIAKRLTTTLLTSITAMTTIAAQLAATVDQHEQTTGLQASAMSETTAAMDELDASFLQSAEQAEVSATRARQALTLTEDGTSAVQQTLGGMANLKGKVEAIAEQILRLSEQTSQIGNITNLVSELAGQTNLLALNAAVEAARAGEHGKGFGVVAAEIRKLADQSKKSAERINTLVLDIQNATNATVMATEEGTKTVEQGTYQTHRTAEVFEGLAASITHVFESSQQTLLNVRQQVAAVRQVVEAMTDLKRGATDTAAGMAQTKSVIAHLNDIAQTLRAAV